MLQAGMNKHHRTLIIKDNDFGLSSNDSDNINQDVLKNKSIIVRYTNESIKEEIEYMNFAWR